MITVFRNKMKSRWYQAIIWIVLFSFGGFFSLLEVIRFSLSPASWAIKVNSKIISHAAFTNAVTQQEEFIRAIKQYYGQYAALILQANGIDADPRIRAFNQLVEQELLNQLAAKLPFIYSDQLVKSKLTDRAFVQRELFDLVPSYVLDEQGNINMNLLRSSLQHRGMSFDDFEKQVFEAIIRSLTSEMIATTAYSPSYEVKEFFMRRNTPRSFTLVSIPFESVLAEVKQQEPTAGELNAFYLQNKAHYTVAQSRNGTIWTFDPSDFGITITPEQVETYYNNHRVDFIETPAQVQVRTILLTGGSKPQAELAAQAEQLRQELLSDPSSFAKRAKEVSQDIETFPNGGLMPFFAKGEKEQSFERAAFVLKNDGDISPVIQTKRGFQILQRAARKDAVYKPLKSVFNDIETRLKGKEFAQKFVAFAKEAHAQGPRTWDAFITEKKGRLKPLNAALKDNDRTIQALFGLQQGTMGFIIDGQHGVAIRLDSVTPEYAPALEEIKDKVTKDWYTMTARNLLQTKIDELKYAIAADGIEAAKGAHIENTPLLSPEASRDSKELAQLKAKGIDPDDIFELVNPGQSTTVITPEAGYVVMVNNLAPFDEIVFEGKKNAVIERMAKDKANLITKGFIASLNRNATIKSNISPLS